MLKLWQVDGRQALARSLALPEIEHDLAVAASLTGDERRQLPGHVRDECPLQKIRALTLIIALRDKPNNYVADLYFSYVASLRGATT